MENLNPIKIRLNQLKTKNKRTLKLLVIESNLYLGFSEKFVRLYKDGSNYSTVDINSASKIQLIASILRSEFGHRRTNIVLPNIA